ncbi:DUF2384 domain-containing protein [Endozoicomonas sp. G2_2]|uniref:antitoxin Xre/MbcA/ParS toxin-binding domain-containing protein n=1 Tax=Endozoicomonas sp. G2_2 TaxID=2821092 RepID=UPI001ADAAABC|nr:antitoxin Xre/MbcA/ParS toxin-binding domain-containing protein [Endozoicomonas sp. G2_2]MBO9471621.1 DUF2384 domain-containing protein [Endozoicomonas sp. G2_2]
MSANVEISQSERTLALLGGKRFIPLSAQELADPAKVRQVIRTGLPVACARYARKHCGVPNRLFDQVVPRTTLISAGKSKSKRLSKPVSEAVLRAAKIIALAEEAFGNRDHALHWLTNPNPVFEDEAPITLADTESGTEWVEQVLGRAMHGVDA